MKKRVLSLLLAAIMMVSLFPVTAVATDAVWGKSTGKAPDGTILVGEIESTSFKVGKTGTFKVFLKPLEKLGGVDYVSSDTSVAIANEKGLITATGAGKATITATGTYQDTALSVSIEVTVTATTGTEMILTYAPTKKKYMTGEGFSPEGFSAVYSNGTTAKTVGASDVTFSVANKLLTPGQVFNTPGVRDVVATYEGYTVKFSLTVKGDAIAGAETPSQPEVDTPESQKDVYKILLSYSPDLCASIRSVDAGNTTIESDAAGARLATSYYKGGTHCQFRLEPVGDKFKIRAMNSNFLITANGRGQVLTQQADDGSDKQLFSLLDNGDGTKTIMAYDGTVFDVSEQSKSSGKDILLWDRNYQVNQKFKVIPIAETSVDPDDLPDGLKEEGLTVATRPTKRLYEVGEGFDLTGISVYWTEAKKATIQPQLSELEFSVDSTKLYQGRAFSEPGLKKVVVTYIGKEGTDSFYINVVPKGQMQATATPSSSKLVVDGKPVSLNAYAIGNKNYFKARDIAMALTGGKYNFDITFDGVNNEMTVTRSTPYTPVGGEMTQGKTQTVTATRSSTLIKIGKTYYGIKGYIIDGNNYFAVRDLAKAVDFSLLWDNATSCIALDSGNLYEIGEKFESFETPRMTMVRGLRIGKTTVSGMKTLYGEPTEILKDGVLYTFEKNEDATLLQEDYLDKEVGQIYYYVYAQDYKNLLIAYVVNDVVVGMYTNTNESVGSGRHFYDKISNKTYATLIEDYSAFEQALDTFIEGKNLRTHEALVFHSTNALRALNGLHMYKISPQATTAAQKYAQVMADTGHFNHNGLDGSTHVSRMAAAGVPGGNLSENIYQGGDVGYGYTEGWLNSPGHRRAMLSQASHYIGVGIASEIGYEGADLREGYFQEYAVQDFY